LKRIIMVAVLALVLISTSAHAADKGMYVSGNVGLSIIPELDQEIAGTLVTTADFDVGFRISGVVGYDFGAFRVEGEIGYRTNDADDGTIVGLGPGPINGDISTLSFMVNGYFDYHSAFPSLLHYVGVGLGVASIDADISNPLLAPFPQIVDDSATVFAYQLIAGLGYNVSPTTTITADYRYFATTDPEFTPGNAFSGSPDLESDYSNHSINLGVRVTF